MRKKIPKKYTDGPKMAIFRYFFRFFFSYFRGPTSGVLGSVADSQDRKVGPIFSGSGEEKEKFLFEHGDLIKASYFQRTAIDKDHGVVQGLDVQLPSGVGLIIDRFGKHLDLRIEMPASAGGGRGQSMIRDSGDPDPQYFLKSTAI